MDDRSPGRLEWAGPEALQQRSYGSSPKSIDVASPWEAHLLPASRIGDLTGNSPILSQGSSPRNGHGLHLCTHCGGNSSPGGSVAEPAVSAISTSSSVASLATTVTASSTCGIEQKVISLSRRTAAELKRVEKDRASHAQRLEQLEQLVQQHFGSLELHALRSKANHQLNMAHGELIQGDIGHMATAMLPGGNTTPHTVPSSAAEAVSGQLEARLVKLEEQTVELRSTLMHRLQASIALAAASLNQRIDAVSKDLKQTLKQGLGALEFRIDALEASNELLQSQHPACHQDFLQRECSRLLELMREETHAVHLEVMSVDTRVAGVEELLAAERGMALHHTLPLPLGASLEQPASAAQLQNLHDYRD